MVWRKEETTGNNCFTTVSSSVLSYIPFSSSIPGDVYSPLELKMKQNGTVTITVITRSRGSHCYGQQT